MKLTPEVTFRGLPHSEALESHIRQKVEKLDRFFEHIVSCRVMMEVGHKHRHEAQIYHVSVALTVPGKELVVSREHQAHEDPFALRDAFDATTRQLEDYSEDSQSRPALCLTLPD